MSFTAYKKTISLLCASPFLGVRILSSAGVDMVRAEAGKGGKNDELSMQCGFASEFFRYKSL